VLVSLSNCGTVGLDAFQVREQLLFLLRREPGEHLVFRLLYHAPELSDCEFASGVIWRASCSPP
jgi:hypothetical protein